MEWLLTLLHNPDAWGHLFYAFILSGTFLIARKKKIGWLNRVVGDIGWIVVGWCVGLSSIMIWSTVFALNDLRGYLLWKWSENENSVVQSKRQAPSTTCMQKDKGNIQSSRGRRSKPANGESGKRRAVKRKSSRSSSTQYRMQKPQKVSKPRRSRASEIQLKAIRDALRDVETTWKKHEPYDNLSKPRRLSKINEGKK